MEQEKIGLIGAGLLGAAIAERLVTAGYALHGYDIDPARRANLERLGGRAAPSAADVARDCSCILLSLPDSKASASVLAEIRAALRPGATILDTTTGTPADAAGFGRALAASGQDYLDTTVAGSSEQARAGDAIVIAGGAAQALERSMPVLRAFGRKVFHAGPCGSGAAMKLVVNLVLGLNRAALAEGLAFAAGCGLQLDSALEILQSGPASSVAMERKGQRMVSRDFDPEARLSQHLKDVRLILAEARAAGVSLPLSERHAALLERAEALGYGGADNSAVIEAYEPPIHRG